MMAMRGITIALLLLVGSNTSLLPKRRSSTELRILYTSLNLVTFSSESMFLNSLVVLRYQKNGITDLHLEIGKRVETVDDGKLKTTMGEGVEGFSRERISQEALEMRRKRLGTPIRRGLGGISMLKWSPTGDYFFAAKFDGTFYLWETNTWTSEPWSSTSGFVTGATWDPDGRMILISFSDSSTLGSIHFASNPPSLDAHLLPVDLPEDQIVFRSRGIEKIAWDGSGERLAVSYKDGDELYKGLIAIYDVRRSKLISASLIGFIRGPGNNPRPVAFSFHDKFKQGPLLSVVGPLHCSLFPYSCLYSFVRFYVLEQRILLYLPSYISVACSALIQFSAPGAFLWRFDFRKERYRDGVCSSYIKILEVAVVCVSEHPFSDSG
ncbi:hypothetical protein C3L33_02286, partial [Rhododendron williamsianum]